MECNISDDLKRNTLKSFENSVKYLARIQFVKGELIEFCDGSCSRMKDDMIDSVFGGESNSNVVCIAPLYCVG